MVNSGVFINVDELPYDFYGFVQVSYLLVTYGAIILYGSSLLSHGSELLLLIPEYSGIVGTIVLPVVGQLPDAVLVLFSGMGSRKTAQKSLDIGVGALAGSCVLLLTIPWFLSIVVGRVSLINHKPNYEGIPRLLEHDRFEGLRNTGVELGPFVRRGSLIMMATAFTYVFLQLPGLIIDTDSFREIAAAQKCCALLGLLIAVVMLIGYMWVQTKAAQESDSVMHNRREGFLRHAIESGEVSVLGALLKEFRHYRPRQGWLASLTPTTAAADQRGQIETQFKETAKLLPDSNPHLRTLRNVLRPFFAKHDPGEGTVGVVELAAVIRDLGELPSAETVKFLSSFDFDHDGRIDFDEFVRGVLLFFEENNAHPAPPPLSRASSMSKSVSRGLSRSESAMSVTRRMSYHGKPLLKFAAGFTHEEKEEDELDALPQDLLDLTPEEQQRRLKVRAAGLIAAGMALILVFSDPVVDAVNSLGVRLGVRPFYVAFVLTPLVTSSVEMLAAYNYAAKQTRKSIGVSLSMLQGAVCMNNTLVLGVFMYLVYAKGLAWEFLAETLTILLVQIFVGIYALKRVHTPLDGLAILSMYPLSIALIAVLEQNGWN